MGDIDFDELDKAVSSLMNSSDAPTSQKKPANSNAKPNSPVVTRSMSTAKSAIKSSKPPVKALDMHITPEKSPVSAPAVKRSGRFMDVVDSSDDLNPIRRPLSQPAREIVRKTERVATSETNNSATTVESKATNAEVFMPKRTSLFKNPVNQLSKTDPVESDSEPVQVRFVPKPTPSTDSLQSDDESALSNEIVKDIANASETRPSTAFAESANTSETDDHSIAVNVTPKSEPSLIDLPTWISQQEDHLEITVAPEDSDKQRDDSKELADESLLSYRVEPIVEGDNKNEDVVVPAVSNDKETDSPFLLDTKIEKRPLNANPTAAAEPSVPEFNNQLLAQVEQLERLAPVEQEPMPTIPHEQPDATTVPELSSELIALESTGKVDRGLEELPVAPIRSTTDGTQFAEPAVKDAVSGPTSISQQYQAKDSSGDTSHAPIYDTTEFAQPVTHPAKKKSGWIWVVAILILLALGSGGAVALYLTGIIP